MKKIVCIFILCIFSYNSKSQSYDDFSNCFEITLNFDGGCRGFMIKVIREGIFISMNVHGQENLDSIFWKPTNEFDRKDYFQVYNEIRNLYFAIDEIEEYKQDPFYSHNNAMRLSVLSKDDNKFKSKLISPCHKEIKKFIKLVLRVSNSPEHQYLKKTIFLHC